MKRLSWILFFASGTFLFAEERVYLPLESLYFTERGIFLEKKACTLELPSIGYDQQGYYLAANARKGVTIEKCVTCKYNTWWVEAHCCLNDLCIYYCY